MSDAHASCTWVVATGQWWFAIRAIRLYRRTNSGSYAGLSRCAPGSKKYDDTPADPATAYFYKVTAVNSIGEGSNSSEFPITAPPRSIHVPGSGVLVDADPTGASFWRLE